MNPPQPQSLPPGITAVTYYQVDLAAEHLFPTVDAAREFSVFVARVRDVNCSLALPEKGSTEPLQHDKQTVRDFEREVKRLVAEMDRPDSSFSALMKKDMLLGLSALLQMDPPRGPLLSALVLRLAAIDKNDCEWRCALKDIPVELRRCKM